MMADRLGVCRQHITDILAARVSVGLDLHERIAAGLEVEPADLFDGLPDTLGSVAARNDLLGVFAYNLKVAMRESSMTVKQLAVAAGIGKTSVYDARNAAVAVRYDIVADMAAALGRTPGALVRRRAPAIFSAIGDTTTSRSVRPWAPTSRAGEANDAVQLQWRG